MKPIRLKGKKLYALYVDVFERDGYTCQNLICKTEFPLDKAPHHKILKSQGGSDTAENLITLCMQCHSKAHGIKLVR